VPEPASEELLYFRAIEDAFIRLRGAPFLLSPGDWRLAQGWYARGVPVELVGAALEEVFARRAERGESGKVQSLRYCAAAVEEAWRTRRELSGGRAPDDDYRLDVARRLERLAQRLPATLARRGGWRRRIRAAGVEARSAETALAELDRELMDSHLASLEPAVRAALEAEVEASLARLGPELAAAVAAADRERLVRENARRAAGLPLLSLFSPDAL